MAELSAIEIAEMIKPLTESQRAIFHSQYASDKKDRGTGALLAFFGYDRFWLGDTVLGILKYLTVGGCGIWWLFDLFTITGRCDEFNRRKAADILQALKISG